PSRVRIPWYSGRIRRGQSAPERGVVADRHLARSPIRRWWLGRSARIDEVAEDGELRRECERATCKRQRKQRAQQPSQSQRQALHCQPPCPVSNRRHEGHDANASARGSRRFVRSLPTVQSSLANAEDDLAVGVQQQLAPVEEGARRRARLFRARTFMETRDL